MYVYEVALVDDIGQLKKYIKCLAHLKWKIQNISSVLDLHSCIFIGDFQYSLAKMGVLT